MYGIPTLEFDYANNPAIFDPSTYEIDPNQSIDQNRYRLRKAMLAAYKKSGISNRVAYDVISRNIDQVLTQILNNETRKITQP